MAQVVKDIIKSKLKEMKLKKNTKILICGLTYKKNVADLRNSLALKILKMFKNKNKYIKGFDPLIDSNTAKNNGLFTNANQIKNFDVFIVLTNHSKMKKILKKVNKNKIIIPI